MSLRIASVKLAYILFAGKKKLPTIDGKTINIPIPKANENIVVNTASLSLNFSSSSPAWLAEKVSSLTPITRDSNNINTPLTKGFLAKLLFLPIIFVFLYTISPEGLLTAVARHSVPLIITPSITACPPMEGLFVLILNSLSIWLILI